MQDRSKDLIITGGSNVYPREVEEVLFTADIGVRTAQELVDAVRGTIRGGAAADPDAVWSRLREEALRMVTRAEAPPPLRFFR